MSYDIRLSVKVQGCDKYAVIGVPEYDSPTYNLGKMFRACMDWDFDQGDTDEDGKWHTNYYPCDFVMERVIHGIQELYVNPKKYKKYEPENGWGTIESAKKALESLRDCIIEKTDEQDIPRNCVYMNW